MDAAGVEGEPVQLAELAASTSPDEVNQPKGDTRIKSALFVDFDNIFGGLLGLDRAAALAFASDPTRWLDRISTAGLPANTHRDFLIRRVYLNPNGWVMDAEWGNESGRLYLQRYRPHLTNAGFEVVDCPTLTSRQKNAADIRMVIDVLSALEARTEYDEIVLASSDADFTPLLQRIRAEDRRAALIASGQVAPAFRSVADWYLDDEGLIEILTEPQNVAPVGQVDATDPRGRGRAEELVRSMLRRADSPIFLAQVGSDLRDSLGTDVSTSRWYGAGTLGAFLRSLDPPLGVDELHVWDPERHPTPTTPTSADEHGDLPPLVTHVGQVTDFPRLGTVVWPRVFDALAEYAASHTFNLTEITAWTRDRLAEESVPVGRTPIGFVVRAAIWGNVSFREETPPTADDIRQAALATTLDRAQAAGLTLTEREAKQFDAWLRGDGNEPSPDQPD